eukprot:GHUV01025342.1.p1 GENE.GHUV01025342.1~~GHUV01025342.1.p1  ORF type:complete len:211 (-),score=22.05 GHUV01025342.1:1936-2568(-)
MQICMSAKAQQHDPSHTSPRSYPEHQVLHRQIWTLEAAAANSGPPIMPSPYKHDVHNGRTGCQLHYGMCTRCLLRVEHTAAEHRATVSSSSALLPLLICTAHTPVQSRLDPIIHVSTAGPPAWRFSQPFMPIIVMLRAVMIVIPVVFIYMLLSLARPCSCCILLLLTTLFSCRCRCWEAVIILPVHTLRTGHVNSQVLNTCALCSIPIHV